MKVVLLANGWVGREVASFLREDGPLKGLLVHSATADLADEIVTASGVDATHVIASDAPHEPETLGRLRAWAPT